MSRYPFAVFSLGILCLAVVPSLLVAAPAPTAQQTAEDVRALAARIDQLISASWTGKDVQPAPVADDAEFCRRVHLDLAGRIPAITAIRDFLDDDRPDKRRHWVDRILDGDPEDRVYKSAFVDHFTNVWRAWLLAQSNQQARLQQPGLEAWLRKRLKANVGYDLLVRELLTAPAAGNTGFTPGVESTAAFFLANENRPENLAGSTARLFLGVKLECAQCHNHPFEKWTRTQFWEYAAFFATAPQGRQGQPQPIRELREIKIPNTEQTVGARFLNGAAPRWQNGVSSRTTLADWLTARDNPYFARAAVNRTWAYFFGTGLVEQADGPGDDNPASHLDVLDELARQFVAHGHDFKFLIRAITASQTYQRSSAVSHPSQQDLRLFARMPLRGLSPEQLFDSLAEATEFHDTSADTGVPAFAAAQSPRGRFLARFAAQEKRTEYQTSILQALYLMNNEFVADRTSVAHNRSLATLAAQATTTSRKIESLYLLVLSRKPRPAEMDRLVKYVESGGPTTDPRKALADVFWVLLNSSEFLLNH